MIAHVGFVDRIEFSEITPIHVSLFSMHGISFMHNLTNLWHLVGALFGHK